MLLNHSKYLENAVHEIAKLPGIGQRTALRLALHVVKMKLPDVQILTNTLLALKQELTRCQCCYNLSDTEICDICAQVKRDHETVCVVQDIRDLIAIENTSQYFGLYHVLGGIISPMDGVSPEQLTLKELFLRANNENIKEIILALPGTVEGDMTNFYIYERVKNLVPEITTLARGVGVGEELEYANEDSIGRSILARTHFETVFNRQK
ncbi:MAG: recombination mediator RecR [Bacteroidales bacterium]|jgi:recombination protein RecR|nr:recombination mediator RecR [Bacteroidales bacterium]